MSETNFILGRFGHSLEYYHNQAKSTLVKRNQKKYTFFTIATFHKHIILSNDEFLLSFGEYVTLVAQIVGKSINDFLFISFIFQTFRS